MTNELDMTKETYTILIVDDEELNLKMISRLLFCDQYSLYTAGNGNDAVELAKQVNPDLVLLDMMMPGLDGVETCMILKNSEGTSHIPVIMVTACIDMETRLRCLRAGANDFLAKPVDDVELQLRVNNLLEFRRHVETLKLNALLEQSKAALECKNRELETALQEIEKTQAQIIEQEKMASIGQLAAGVAHEINNPMGFISSNLGTLNKYVDRLSEYIGAGDRVLQACRCSNTGAENLTEERKRLKIDYIMNDAHQLILESQEGTGRILRIVQNLKNFTRSDQVKKELFNLNKALESTINIAMNEIKYVATLTLEFDDVPEILCYPHQLNQVFLNLLVNAGHAMEGTQGSITIRTWKEADDVFVSFADTGCGISAEIQKRIFEPFFTTKEAGKGTGLGLSISYDIVRKHGGEITVESEAGHGATFTVQLPIAGSALEPGSP